MQARWLSGAAVLAGAALFGAAVGGVAATDRELRAVAASSPSVATARPVPVVDDHCHGRPHDGQGM